MCNSCAGVCGVWGVAECSRGGQGAGAGNGAAPREKSIVTEIDGSGSIDPSSKIKRKICVA